MLSIFLTASRWPNYGNYHGLSAFRLETIGVWKQTPNMWGGQAFECVTVWQSHVRQARLLRTQKHTSHRHPPWCEIKQFTFYVKWNDNDPNDASLMKMLQIQYDVWKSSNQNYWTLSLIGRQTPAFSATVTKASGLNARRHRLLLPEPVQTYFLWISSFLRAPVSVFVQLEETKLSAVIWILHCCGNGRWNS